MFGDVLPFYYRTIAYLISIPLLAAATYLVLRNKGNQKSNDISPQDSQK